MRSSRRVYDDAFRRDSPQRRRYFSLDEDIGAGIDFIDILLYRAPSVTMLMMRITSRIATRRLMRYAARRTIQSFGADTVHVYLLGSCRRHDAEVVAGLLFQFITFHDFSFRFSFRRCYDDGVKM